jgi:hypothetical protein
MSTTRFYRMLNHGEVIDDDTEFETSPGIWERLADCASVSARWMIGSRYNPSFFVPARTPAKPPKPTDCV